MRHEKVVQAKKVDVETSDLLSVVSQAGGDGLAALSHGDDYVLAAYAVRAAGLGGQLAAQYRITLGTCAGDRRGLGDLADGGHGEESGDEAGELHVCGASVVQKRSFCRRWWGGPGVADFESLKMSRCLGSRGGGLLVCLW